MCLQNRGKINRVKVQKIEIPDNLFLEEIEEVITKTFKQLNEKILEKYSFGGSTANITLQYEDTLITAHVGDSEAYLFHANPKKNKPQFYRINTLHNYDNPEESKRIGKDNFTYDKNGKIYRIKGTGLAMSRAFGDKSSTKYGVTAEPEIYTTIIDYSSAPYLLMNCDGLTEGEFSQEKIENFLASEIQKGTPVAEISKKLAEQAIAQKSMDNVSVILRKLTPQEKNIAILTQVFDGHGNDKVSDMLYEEFASSFSNQLKIIQLKRSRFKKCEEHYDAIEKKLKKSISSYAATDPIHKIQKILLKFSYKALDASESALEELDEDDEVTQSLDETNKTFSIFSFIVDLLIKESSKTTSLSSKEIYEALKKLYNDEEKIFSFEDNILKIMLHFFNPTKRTDYSEKLLQTIFNEIKTQYREEALLNLLKNFLEKTETTNHQQKESGEEKSSSQADTFLISCLNSTNSFSDKEKKDKFNQICTQLSPKYSFFKDATFDERNVRSLLDKLTPGWNKK